MDLKRETLPGAVPGAWLTHPLDVSGLLFKLRLQLPLVIAEKDITEIKDVLLVHYNLFSMSIFNRTCFVKNTDTFEVGNFFNVPLLGWMDHRVWKGK